MTRALGIDIGSFSIKISEIEIGPRGRSLIGLYEIDRNPQSDVAELLANFMRASGIQPERISVGLGNAPVYVKRIEFPFSDRKKVASAIQGELEDSLPFEISNQVIDIRPLGKTAKMFQFIVGLCPQAYLDTLNGICDRALILPSTYSLDAEALAQLALSQNLSAAEYDVPYMVCDFGYATTKIAIIKGSAPHNFDKKLKPKYSPEILEVRTLLRGSHELVDWIHQQKGLSVEEAQNWLLHRAEIKAEASSDKSSMSEDMSDELKVALRPVVVEIYQTLQAFRGKHNQTPSVMYLTGGMSEIKGLKEFLADELRIEVSDWQVTSGFTTDTIAITPEKMRLFGVSLALAHRWAIRKPMGWLNFRRSQQANRKIITHFFLNLNQPQYKPALLGLAACFVAALIYSFSSNYFLSKLEDMLRTEAVGEFRKAERDMGKRAEKWNIETAQKNFDAQLKKKQAEEKDKKGVTQLARSDLLLDFSMALPTPYTVREFSADASLKTFSFDSKVDPGQPIGDQEIAALQKTLQNNLKNYSDVKVERSIVSSDRNIRIKAKWKGNSP